MRHAVEHKSSFSGLSPLARGTLLLTPAILNGWRFIPAGAGNTPDCGICSVQILGLSPLARGTLNHQPRPPITTPVYPRWRGEHGDNGYPLAAGSPVYPRWRGEHMCNSLISDLPSPRFIPAGAGTPVPGRRLYDSIPLRFIPAGAGNTRWIRVLHSTAAVCPGWRGQRSGRSTGVQIPGLSPLARGTRRAPTE